VKGRATPDADAEAARVGRIYDGYARSSRRRRAWAADSPGNRAIRAELLEAVLDEAHDELASGGKVLDIGCGTGFWLAKLHGAGIAASRLTGIDVLSERAEHARRRVPGATILHADARALPFQDDYFSIVLMFTLLSSLSTGKEARRAMDEARRVVQPGGLLLAYEPCLPSPWNRAAHRITARDFKHAGITPRRETRLTLIPPIARRLGSKTEALYPLLAGIPGLRSHRLIAYRKPRLS
jgi:ubiquinone/menaquinone biosynthesis C-methylase UbiE